MHIGVNAYLKGEYGNKCDWTLGENKAKQSQFVLVLCSVFWGLRKNEEKKVEKTKPIYLVLSAAFCVLRKEKGKNERKFGVYSY